MKSALKMFQIVWVEFLEIENTLKGQNEVSGHNSVNSLHSFILLYALEVLGRLKEVNKNLTSQAWILSICNF